MAHVKWEGKYHVVFIPKHPKKVLSGKLRKRVGEIFQKLCRHKGIELLVGHAMPDHVHMRLSIPTKFSVSMAIGYIKGKSAIRVHREFMGRRKQFTGFHFLAPGYCVSMISLDEHRIREYKKTKRK
jgi:putative transposase